MVSQCSFILDAATFRAKGGNQLGAPLLFTVSSEPALVVRGHAHIASVSERLGSFRLRADRCGGRAAVSDFPTHKSSAEPLGDLFGLLEHVLRALEVLRAPAGDERAGPAGTGAGQQQSCAEALLDLRGGREVALGLLVAPQGGGEGAERPIDRAEVDATDGTELAGEGL